MGLAIFCIKWRNWTMIKNNQKIPEGWSVKKLGELANHVKYGIVDGPFGSNLKTEHYRNSGIPVIQSGFVTSQRFYAEKYLYVDDDLFQREKRSATHGNDIIMAKIGAHAGTSAILPENHPESILAGNCLKITINPTLANNRFVLLTLHTKYDKDAFIDIKSTTAQPAISMENLKKLKILLPPLPEQEKIAEILGTWDEAIEKLSDLIEQKKLLKKGLMQKLLTGKTRLPGFTQPWQEVKLGELCKINTGKKDVNEGNPDGLYPFFTCARTNTFSDSFSFDKEAILIAGNGEVGNCQYYVGKFEAYQRTYVLSDFKVIGLLLFQYLSYFFKQYVENQKQQGAMPYIKLKTLTDFCLFMPTDKSEQNKILKLLSIADDEINLLNQKLEALKEQKKGLMQQLLTGQIRVKVS